MITVPPSPTISVLMSVHNGRQFLAEAVESILRQTFTDFEFIIVDDGSTDGSTELLRHFAKRDPRIRLLIQDNVGLTKSLNTGLRIARGEFIARMDADDIAKPLRFEKQIKYLRENPDVVCVGTQTRYIDERGVSMFNRHLPTDHDDIERCHLSLWGGFIMHPTAFMRYAALKRVGGYDERFPKAQDYDLWFRLSKVGRLANLSERLLYYRKHPEAITQSQAEVQSECVVKILKRELDARGIDEPLSLDKAYLIDLNNPRWGLKKSLSSFCFFYVMHFFVVLLGSYRTRAKNKIAKILSGV